MQKASISVGRRDSRDSQAAAQDSSENRSTSDIPQTNPDF